MATFRTVLSGGHGCECLAVVPRHRPAKMISA